MKKFIIALLFLAGTLGFTKAQAQQKTPVKKPAFTTKIATVEGKEQAVAKKPGMKKDGTPDMRLKGNKTTLKTVPSGPLKKNGTADMRYKANKANKAATK